MKSNRSYLYCVVLIYGVICCVEVIAEHDESSSAANACVLEQLKSKEILNDDFPINEQPANCSDLVLEMSKMHDRIFKTN